MSGCAQKAFCGIPDVMAAIRKKSPWFASGIHHYHEKTFDFLG
jgi:hypothetical protein